MTLANGAELHVRTRFLDFAYVFADAAEAPHALLLLLELQQLVCDVLPAPQWKSSSAWPRSVLARRRRLLLLRPSLARCVPAPRLP